MIDLQILRQQVQLGASPAQIVDLVEQMLAADDPPPRGSYSSNPVVTGGGSGATATVEIKRERTDKTRETDRIRSKRYRDNKRSALLAKRDACVTHSVTLRDAEPSCVTRVTNETVTFTSEDSPKKSTEDFPDLALRFALPTSVTLRDDMRDDMRDASNISTESITSLLPLQNPLFPELELQRERKEEEERKKERTKERKKEEEGKKEKANCLSVSKEESKTGYARAREGSSVTEPSHLPKPRGKPRTAIADDFALTSAMLAFAQREGLSVGAAQIEAYRFADHARASGRLCADWMAAWRNWIRSPYRLRTAPPHEQPFDVRRHIV